jgi:hypothetical protein
MTDGLHRFHESGPSVFLIFELLSVGPQVRSPDIYNLFVECCERVRMRFENALMYPENCFSAQVSAKVRREPGAPGEIKSLRHQSSYATDKLIADSSAKERRSE